MSKTPSSSGKGDKRRAENAAKVRDNWDQINWSKRKTVELNEAELLKSMQQAVDHYKRELAPKRSIVKRPDVIVPPKPPDASS
jgi:hypothetical protein